MIRRKVLIATIVALAVGLGGYAVWRHWMAPTRILVVNALEAQQADFVLNNDSRHIEVECMDAEEMHDIDAFDAIIIYARRIFLTDDQMEELRLAAERGVPPRHEHL